MAYTERDVNPFLSQITKMSIVTPGHTSLEAKKCATVKNVAELSKIHTRNINRESYTTVEFCL